jgi:hypothetical protein
MKKLGYGWQAVQMAAWLCLLISLNIQSYGQAEKQKPGKDEEKGEVFSGNVVNIEGEIRCAKAEPSYAIDVPDRSGHSLSLSHRKCEWTKPWAIAGVKTKTGVAVGFAEKMEGVLHQHGFEVDTLDNGDQVTMRTMGQTPDAKGPVEGRGRWSFMRGTGKFKGIKGGGSYESKVAADDTLTMHLEGVYVPAEMAAGQDSKK